MAQTKVDISLRQTIGYGYDEFWKCKCRYRVVKGSRASKKSKTTAINMIWNLWKYPLSNGLCVRRYQNTLRDSVYSDLLWAIHKLHLDPYFDCTVSPMQITRKKTGQKILFRGLDDGMKITSISVDKGVLCWVWIEEAYEIENEEDFNKLDMSIRGEVPEGYYKQITLTFNPWSDTHWLKRRFFDKPNENVFAITTNWTCNEWLDEADKELFLDMKKHDPDRYRVEGEGDWGVSQGQYFGEFRKSIHVMDAIALDPNWRRYISIDYGLDRLAVLWHCVDNENNVYTYREYCESDLIISEAAKKIVEYTPTDEKIYSLLAPPDLWGRDQRTGRSRATQFNEAFAELGSRLSLAKSNNDREAGWLAIKELLKYSENKQPRLHIFSNCTELISCLPALLRDPKYPTDTLNEPHEITHAPDSLRYFAIYWIHPADPIQERTVYYRPDQLEDYYRATPEQKIMIIQRMGGKPR